MILFGPFFVYLLKIPSMTTMSSARTYSVEEYLRLERETGERFAYFNGTLHKMAGGSIAHNRICRNVLGLLFAALQQQTDFEIFGSDQKIYLPKYRFYVYADVVVVAGTPVQTDDMTDALTNPLLIIETLSASTEHYDLGQKFLEYQSLPSFREYVLLRQDLPEALLFFREAPDVWRSSEATGLEGELTFRSIGVTLAMQAAYDRVEFS